MIQFAQLAIEAGDCRLAGIDLSVQAGEHVVLTGVSGSGKSTLLEALVGLRPIASGAILLRGIDCRELSVAERGLGYVPQDGALFPTMSVRDNLAYALRARRRGRAEREERVAAVAATLRLGALLDRGIASLSGGEARRVAIGRAIAFEPDILLLDEPTNGLDHEATEDVYTVIRELKAGGGMTILHATHDSLAERSADRVVRIQDGTLVELDASIKPSIAIARVAAS